MNKLLLRHRCGIPACLVAPLLLLALLFATFSYPPLTHRVLRPLTEALASHALHGTVTLEELDVSRAGLRLTGLHIVTPEDVSLSVKSVSLGYTLRGLMAREMDDLSVSVARLHIGSSGVRKTERPASLSLPTEFPLTIGHVELSDGTVIVEYGGREIRFDEIRFSARTGEPNRFRLSVRLGADSPDPLQGVGTFAWPGKPALVLETLRWGGRSFLAEPLHLIWSPTDGPTGAGEIGIEHIDGKLLETVARAFNRPSPLPPGLGFSLTNTRVQFSLREKRSRLHVGVEQGRFCREDRCVPVGNVDLQLTKQAGKVQQEGEPLAGSDDELRAGGIADGNALQADFGIALPDMAAAVSALSGAVVPVMSGGVTLAGTCRIEGSGVANCRAQLGGTPPRVSPDQPLVSLEPLGGSIVLSRTVESFQARADLRLSGEPLGRVEGSPDEIRWTLAPRSWTSLKSLLGPGVVPDALVDVRGLETSGRIRTREKEAWSAEAVGTLGTVETRFGTFEGIRITFEGHPDQSDQTAAHVSLQLNAVTNTQVAVVGGLRSKTACSFSEAGRMRCNASLEGTTPDTSGGSDRTLSVSLEPVRARLLLVKANKTWNGEASLLLGDRAAGSATFNSADMKWEFDLDSLKDLGNLLGRGLLPSGLQKVEGLKSSGTVSWAAAGQPLKAMVSATVAHLEFDPLTAEETVLSFEAEHMDKGLTIRSLSLGTRLSGGALPAGTLSLEGSGTFDRERLLFHLESLNASDLEYLSPDGLSGFGGGFLRAAGTLERLPPGNRTNIRLSGSTGVREVLAGWFYADLSAVTADFNLDAGIDAAKAISEIQEARLRFGDMGALQLSGHISDEALDLRALIHATDLAPWNGILGPALHDISPHLASMSMSGELVTDLHLVRTPGLLRARGETVATDISFASEDLGLRLDRASGNIPIDLTFGADPLPEEPGGAPGRLRFSGFSSGPLGIRSPEVEFTVRTNRVRLTSPLVFSLAKGRVVADTLSVNRESTGMGIEGRLRVEDVDLETLTEELRVPPMKGHITADLGSIRYAQNILASDGEALIRAFGGELHVRNLYMESPFSRFRTINGDVDFSAIDLHELSQTFEFGEMNGVVDGYVHQLRLFDATPSRLVARIETRDKGKRDISVKALNNLSIISQGGLTAVLSRGMYRFIDFYRYRKIGIYCELENDIFTLVGTALEGSDQYLVYGGLMPPRIDIVAPAQRISFKEMLKRIRRVDRKRT